MEVEPRLQVVQPPERERLTTNTTSAGIHNRYILNYMYMHVHVHQNAQVHVHLVQIEKMVSGQKYNLIHKCKNTPHLHLTCAGRTYTGPWAERAFSALRSSTNSLRRPLMKSGVLRTSSASTALSSSDSLLWNTHTHTQRV